MLLRRAIFLACLTAAPLDAAAQEVAWPAVQSLAEPKLAKPKAKETTRVSPSCPGKDASFCFGANDPRALPTPVQIKGWRAGNNAKKPKLFLKAAPEAQRDVLLFQNNDNQPQLKARNVGGGVGLKFPF